MQTPRNLWCHGQTIEFGSSSWLSTDARIDNRQELTSKLHASPTSTDAELILLSYQKWGEDCVKHLLGDFAFAIWDADVKRLFCARDHFGVKPFFFAHVDDSFIFSNSLNAVRLEASVSDTLNEVAVGDYLLFGLNQHPSSTIFRDIQRVPAAHTLTFSNNSITTRRYWTLEIPNPIRFRDDRDYVERFDELLTTAVADRLRTDRVAISMSGGLDSTSLAAIACDLLDRKVHAVSNVYDALIPDDERRYSTHAADHIGIPITHISADRFTLFEQRESLDLQQPEPFLMSPLSGQFNELLRTCANHGRIMLTGYDGDAFMHEPARRSLASSARGQIRRVFGRSNRENFFPEWIDESFAKRTNLRERAQSETVTGNNKQRPAAFSFFNSKVWTPLFEGYDRASTRLDLEVRHPLIDVRLVEYLLAIPTQPWCVNKHILRMAMKDRLPAEVINRQKTPLAGDPALQLVRHASVRWLDSFEVNPQLEGFVNLKLRRPIADEQTSEALWASLRVFALNHWLTNSQPIDRRTTEIQLKQNRAYQTSIA